jgi:sec-independent protein translocase protein TatA
MGIENPVHLIFLAAVALVVLGPKRLPELARAAGKGMREFRESLNGEGADHEQPGAVVVQPAPAPSQAQPPYAQPQQPPYVQPPHAQPQQPPYAQPPQQSFQQPLLAPGAPPAGEQPALPPQSPPG